MLKSPEKDKWLEAMEEEMANMKRHKVWHLVKIPPGKSTVGSRWVYNVKKDEFGRIARYKARLVAQGYTQIKGETFDETFSPVVNFSVIRLFFTLLVVYLKWKNVQCDVRSAYLYAPLTEEIYMEQPPGYVERGNETLVCRLDKAIYGLHQSGRLWFFELDRVLGDLGFDKFSWCNCVYKYKNFVILLVYVDDIVIFGKEKRQIDEVLNILKGKFDLKILGITKKLLGVEFEYCDDCVYLHQHLYIEDVLARFKSYNFPFSSLPIAKGIKYSKSNCPKTEEEIQEMSSIPYRNVLGCLSFLNSRTRPDISYAVNIFAQFQSNPGMHHWCGLLKLLGYIAYTKDYKLKLTCSEPTLTIYSDADFASNRDDMVSVGGYLTFFGEASISWKTFKERGVSLSTMEAEFIAMTEAAKELLWFKNILNECHTFKILRKSIDLPVLLADNMAAIEFTRSPIENNRTKHINVKLFFIRDLLRESVFDLKFIRSKSNLADPFTKPLTRQVLQDFCRGIFSW